VLLLSFYKPSPDLKEKINVNSPETVPSLEDLEEQWDREDAAEAISVAAGDTTSDLTTAWKSETRPEVSAKKRNADSLRSAFSSPYATRNETQMNGHAGNGAVPEVEILPDGSRRLKGLEEDPFRFVSPKRNETQNATHFDLSVQTAPEISAQEDYEVSWVWDGFLAKGTMTILAGKPKVGKSTMYFDLIRAMEHGEPFLGCATVKTGALILSEESGVTIKPKSGGLPATVQFLLWEKNHEIPYPILIHEAVKYCLENDLGLLVLDSLADWSGVQEGDAQGVLDALKPLREAAAAGLAVLIVHHHRKAAGTDGDQVRGSNALTGAVDTFIDLERRKSVGKNARYVSTNSRLPDPPEEFVYERCAEGGYRVLDPSEAKLGTKRSGKGSANIEAEKTQLLAVLSESPGSTKEELAHVLDWAASRAYTRLNALQDEGKVRHEGAGGKGDPHRWSLIEKEELAA
jgi:AAA domain